MNNRIFKFRVWDKDNKKMYPVLQLFTSNDSAYAQVRVDDEEDIVNWLIVNNCVIQQFTGLVDKNGKEIYENDIVKVSRCHTKDEEISKGCIKVNLVEDGIEIGKVFWAAYLYEYSVSFEHIRYDDCEKLMGASHRYEVIGHIFEEPETP